MLAPMTNAHLRKMHEYTLRTVDLRLANRTSPTYSPAFVVVRIGDVLDTMPLFGRDGWERLRGIERIAEAVRDHAESCSVAYGEPPALASRPHRYTQHVTVVSADRDGNELASETAVFRDPLPGFAREWTCFDASDVAPYASLIMGLIPTLSDMS
jgi:hypothetical protein